MISRLISIYRAGTDRWKQPLKKIFYQKKKKAQLFEQIAIEIPPMNPQSTTKIRPAKRLMEASGKCSSEGLAYGNCVLNNYTAIKKDMCGQEFIKFKTCVTNQLAKK